MPANDPILVIGGTGMLGEPVARRLQADGFPVRILTRSPEKAAARFDTKLKLVQGDVNDQASLLRALDGCRGVHINLKGGPTAEDFDRIEHRGTAAVVAAARQVGVEQITYLSGYTICQKNALSASTLAKWQAEQAIRASGIPYVIFRASWFMESLPEFVQGNWALVIGRQPHPLHWLAAADYAHMVSRSYQNPAAMNNEFYIYGPQTYTMKQALQTYVHLSVPEARVLQVPLWPFSLGGLFNAELKEVAEYMRYYGRIGEDGDPQAADELLGKPTTTLEQWCQTPGRWLL